jgi:hypothetical protein
VNVRRPNWFLLAGDVANIPLLSITLLYGFLDTALETPIAEYYTDSPTVSLPNVNSDRRQLKKMVSSTHRVASGAGCVVKLAAKIMMGSRGRIEVH